MTPFTITETERNSALWAKLMAHLEVKLAKARTRNDLDADERTTAATRGEIRAYLSLLKLNEERPDLSLD